MWGRVVLTFLLVISMLPFIRATTVIGTTNITFADTIVAKVVSEIYDYPLIILGRDKVSNETLAFLRELNTTEILIIGGPAVISPTVDEELRKLGYSVTRIWGVTRYETSALVSKLFWTNSSEAVIVTRELTCEIARMRELSIVRDAMNLAISKGIPLMITPRGTLDLNVIDALVTLGTKKVYIFTTKEPENIIKQLERLNISYIIVKDNSTNIVNCIKSIRVAVPENASWMSNRRLLTGFKCLKIIVYRYPMNVSNADFTISENSDIHRIMEHVVKEPRRRVRGDKTDVENLLYSRVEGLLEDLQRDLLVLKKYYNISKDQKVLLVINRLEHKIDEIINLLKQGKIREALRLALIEQSKIKRFKWKLKIYKFEEKISNTTRDIVNKLIEQRIKLLKKLYEIEDEELDVIINTRGRMPDLLEIKKLIKKILKKKYGHILSRIVPCPNTSKGYDVICIAVYDPVCAVIETPNGVVGWLTFPNSCVACRTPGVTGYIPGECKRILNQDERIKVRMRNRTRNITKLIDDKYLCTECLNDLKR
ncbi:MAG TPA: hypothetical protein EYH09_01605 [Candidatus Nanopusillus sp.]|nr:hypothetical protein [Candidatus Nanopusillus sp.]